MSTRTTAVLLLTLALVRWASAARILRQQGDIPIIRGTPLLLQETPEYNRYGNSGQELLMNTAQSQVQRGFADTDTAVVMQTNTAGGLDSGSRQAIGQNHAQTIVGNAADGGRPLAPNANFGSVQYQVYGQGLSVDKETRSQLSSTDGQRGIQATLDTGNAFIATQNNADDAFATVFGPRSQRWTGARK